MVTRILGNFACKIDNKEFVDFLMERHFLTLLTELLNLVLTEKQQELFENILHNLGNLITITEATRLKVFDSGVMDLAISKYSIFENNDKVAESMVWILSNALDSRYHLTDDLQFDLFKLVVDIFLKHPSENIFKECIWSMKFLLARESKLADRIQCIVKSQLISIIIKHIKKNLGGVKIPDWIELGFDGLTEFISKAGTEQCSANFVEVV